MSVADQPAGLPAAASDGASDRRDRLRQIFRSGTFLAGLVIVLFWVFCAIFGTAVVPYDPYADDLLNALLPPSQEHWFGTDQLGRDVFSRVIVGARDILTVAPLATLLSAVCGTALGLAMGYFQRRHRRSHQPHRRCIARSADDHRGVACLGRLGSFLRDGHSRDRFHLHADHRTHGSRQRAGGARAGLCGGRAASTRGRSCTSCSSRFCRT